MNGVPQRQDLKPLNIVRVEDWAWKLIDLDASTHLGECVSSKCVPARIFPPVVHTMCLLF